MNKAETLVACMNLVGTHDAAADFRCEALAEILSADSDELSYEARRVQTVLADAFRETLESGSNCLGHEEWSYLQAYVEYMFEGYENINESLEAAYEKVRDMSFIEQSDYLHI